MNKICIVTMEREKSSDLLMGWEQYRPYIKDYLRLCGCHENNGMYDCPVCGSGKKRKHTGAFKVYSDGHGHCFSCGFHGDIGNLISATENISLKAAFKRAISLFGNGYLSNELPKPKEPEPIVTAKKGQYKDYVKQCIEERGYTDYFAKRGFSDKDVERFNLGYDRLADSIMIPYDKYGTYYLLRSTTEKKFKKPPSKVAGPEPIYNVAALEKTTPCFVCESPIDAISVMVASPYNAIAIGGTGIKKLVRYIDEHEVKAPLIISLDDDKDKEKNIGQQFANDLMLELASRGIPCVLAEYTTSRYPADKSKDANDMLLSNRTALSQDLENNASLAKFCRRNNKVAMRFTDGPYKGKLIVSRLDWHGHRFSKKELKQMLGGCIISIHHNNEKVSGYLEKQNYGSVTYWGFKAIKGGSL